MDYEEFLNSLKNDLQNYYSNAGITIENADVQKMQGESYQGLQIKRDGSNVGITMDMHNFFAELEDGIPYHDVMMDVRDAVSEALNRSLLMNVDVGKLSNYEEMKRSLMVQLVSTEKNKEMLSRVPHKEMADMSMIYRFDLGDTGNSNATILVTNQMLQNYGKTEEGEYISSYACSAETAAEEFALSKEEYLRITGRVYKGDILAYQIRQSFKPGEITPEEANKIGYETAMRFTRGEHAFIVCTHTDRAHIHNHIIFNSVALDCTRKFKNFFFCGLALQTLSDIICFEHGKSIIQKRPVGKRKKRTVYPQRHSFRDALRSQINDALQKKPQSLEAFLSSLEQSGYQVKRGKHIAVKGHGQKCFIRLDSLGEGFSQSELDQLISGKSSKRRFRSKDERMDLLINMQDKILEGKGAGYQRWAEKFNVKQMAKVLLFLQENNIHDMKDLRRLASEASRGADGLFDTIHAKDARLEEIRQLKNHIFNYSKTKDIYEEYRRTGYDPLYLEEHAEEIQLHEKAKAAFDQLPDKKIPKVKDLNAEYGQVIAEKKKVYAEYRMARNKAKELQIALKNAEIILEDDQEQTKKRSRKNLRDQSH